LGLVFHFSSTYYLSQSAQYIVTTYKSYTAPHSIFYASAIFLLFKNIDFKKVPSFIIKIFDFFSGQTFGVYLIHIFLIPIADKYIFIQFNDIFAYTYLYKTVGVVIIFISCALITKLLQKIPVIKHLIP
jgi:surface polysaccharide O-acyltransferase-like enzyme